MMTFEAWRISVLERASAEIGISFEQGDYFYHTFVKWGDKPEEALRRAVVEMIRLQHDNTGVLVDLEVDQLLRDSGINGNELCVPKTNSKQPRFFFPH